MKNLIPLVLLLVGIGGGVGAGLALRPDAAEELARQDDTSEALADTATAADTQAGSADGLAGLDRSEDDPVASGGSEYIKLNNQFVVPIVARDTIEAVIVMSLSLEVPEGQSEAVYQHEPKLRDVFLQVMFDHANMGGFAGVFTDTARLDMLRSGLMDVANPILDGGIKSVLITDFVRQTI